MNIRMHKRIKVAQITHSLFFGHLIPQFLTPTRASSAAFHGGREMYRLEAETEAKAALLNTPADIRVTVIKKSSGEVVATDVTISEAEAMIQKAKAGKKAALVIQS